MRALIQRVREASVSYEDVQRDMGPGFVILLGVGAADGKAEAEKLWQKISHLRIFRDAEGKTNLSLHQVGGNVMVISQFTLWANCRRGNRPSFIEAAPAEQAESLYEYFKQLVGIEFPNYVCGKFGADMDVELINQGPFTIWLDTEQL